MNRRMVLYTVGTTIKIEAALMLLPAVCALIYKEESLAAILISAAICLAAGFLLTLTARPGNRVIYAREGFITVALAWIALSAFGALPFYISGEIPSYIDAFFETVSPDRFRLCLSGPLCPRSQTQLLCGQAVD